MAKKTALITGITGQDGSYLAELLLAKGYEVHGIIRRTSDFNTSRIDHIFPPEDKKYIHFGDLAQGFSELLYNLKPDEVYNMASMSHVRVSFDIPIYTGDVTGIAVCRILEAIRQGVNAGILRKDIKYYQASSSEMFGQTPTPKGGYNENSLFTPVSPYGCFPAGTLIISKKEQNRKNNKKSIFIGNKKIEEIKIGDEVLSYNEQTGKKEWKKVKNTMIRDSKELYCFEFSNNNYIECTEEHPFYVINKGWVQAKDLKENDKVIQYKYSGLNFRLNKNTCFSSERKEKISKSMKKAWINSSKLDRKEWSKKFKEIRKNINIWNKGLTKKTDCRLNSKSNSKKTEVKEKISNSVKNLWKDLDYLKKQLNSRNTFPNKKEKIIIDILSKNHPKEFAYNGGLEQDIIIGRKIPDFININGKKKVIEFFGDYWHSLPYKTSEKDTIKHYRKFGFDCLIIWEHELKDIEKVKNRIENFIYNPSSEIIYVTKKYKKSINCKVYNFEVEDNNNYFAYGILVHNCAKLYGYHITRTYRKGYNLFASNGILFNHESPRRGPTFVTRKITRAACSIKLGLQDKLILGNLDAKRDWGHSKDYMEAIYLIMQADRPDDWVVATGEHYSVKDFVIAVFNYLDLDWERYVKYDKSYERANEVPELLGNSTKITTQLGWKPKYDFKSIVKEMVDEDMKNIKNDIRIEKKNIG